MESVDPVYLLQRLRRLNVEVDNYRLLIITHDDAGEWFVLTRIDLLMGHERWHIDEVTRASFGNEFETLSPPHPRPATDYVNYALQFSVMMGPCFGVRVDGNGTHP